MRFNNYGTTTFVTPNVLDIYLAVIQIYMTTDW